MRGITEVLGSEIVGFETKAGVKPVKQFEAKAHGFNLAQIPVKFLQLRIRIDMSCSDVLVVHRFKSWRCRNSPPPRRSIEVIL